MKKKLPPLLYVTNEGRRVYEFNARINGRKIIEIHIDSHYEESHREYMTDEIIYNLAWELEKENLWKTEEVMGEWRCYSTYPLFFEDWRAYKMIWCLKDKADFLGIRSCYRLSKYDKRHKK